MSTDAPQDTLDIPSYPTVVVAGTLLLFSLLFAVIWLYEYKWAPSAFENTWLASQRISSQPGPQDLDDDTMISLQRAQCFGSCPAYQISIFGSGRVEFRGDAFVCEKGAARAQIDSASIQTLLKGLAIVAFDNMPNYTREDATDAPTVTVTLKRPTGLHVVRHYHGDSTAPRLLNWIEDRIDVVAGSAPWTGVQDHHGRYCIEKDGTKRPILTEDRPNI
jgi:Domain of unknown function (DUF6438)